jgi:DNA-binding CsgD family transcriptional regulator
MGAHQGSTRQTRVGNSSAGDNEQATTWYEESLRMAEKLGSRLIATESLEGLACAAGTKGEAERAARLFGVSQALREALNYQQPPGEHALREPYLAAARSRLEVAVWEAAFAEGKAVQYALSKEEPAMLGPLATERRSDEPTVALTRREREVAALVTQGLTNRQIASELMVSGYTVNNHVANILKKLDLHSREQVAARLTER